MKRSRIVALCEIRHALMSIASIMLIAFGLISIGCGSKDKAQDSSSLGPRKPPANPTARNRGEAHRADEGEKTTGPTRDRQRSDEPSHGKDRADTTASKQATQTKSRGGGQVTIEPESTDRGAEEGGAGSGGRAPAESPTQGGTNPGAVKDGGGATGEQAQPGAAGPESTDPE